MSYSTADFRAGGENRISSSVGRAIFDIVFFLYLQIIFIYLFSINTCFILGLFECFFQIIMSKPIADKVTLIGVRSFVDIGFNCINNMNLIGATYIRASKLLSHAS